MRLGRAAGAAVCATVAAAALVLAGCADTPEFVPPTPASEPSSEPTTPPTPTPTPTATPFTADCTELVPSAVLTGVLDGFASVAGFAPPAGSVGASVLDAGGTVCGWRNGAGQTLMVGVAQLDGATLLGMKNELVMTSHSVPTYGVEGYFQLLGGQGEAQAFQDPYWIVSTSVRFAEPGEAQPVVAAVLAALG